MAGVNQSAKNCAFQLNGSVE